MNRNKTLATKIKAIAPNVNYMAAAAIPLPNTTNLSGNSAYALSKELRLISMLNTLKLEPQYYRTETTQIKELKELIDSIGKKDPYFVAQCIVYSRCMGEGMRTINHAAAVLLAKHLAGTEWGARFYSLFNKKGKTGGTIFRPDDMVEIAEAFKAYTKKNIPNSMKRGFKNALENIDGNLILKYKDGLIDICNLVHPNPNKAASVLYEGKKVSVIEAIMKGYKVSADTWEANQSEAGQIVAAAVKDGRVKAKDAEQMLAEAKEDNWIGMLKDNRLGILALLRNLRNIIKLKPSVELMKLTCELLTDKKRIIEGKIMPYQIDIAREVVLNEFCTDADARTIATALLVGYNDSIPNLAGLMTGRNLVILDVSGSMNRVVNLGLNKYSKSSCLEKGALIASTIALGTNADIIQFGGTATYFKYDPNENVFQLAKRLHKNMGSTNLAAAWTLAAKQKYDRVFIISDNEANRSKTYDAYKSYVQAAGQPYVYSVDLAAYGTTQVAGDKVQYFFGYGLSMFEAIATTEFQPLEVIEKIRKIRI